jgi:hypothetical protein
LIRPLYTALLCRPRKGVAYTEELELEEEAIHLLVDTEKNQELFKAELSSSHFRVLPIDFDFDGVKVHGF